MHEKRGEAEPDVLGRRQVPPFGWDGAGCALQDVGVGSRLTAGLAGAVPNCAEISAISGIVLEQHVEDGFDVAFLGDIVLVPVEPVADGAKRGGDGAVGALLDRSGDGAFEGDRVPARGGVRRRGGMAGAGLVRL
jgi:hypothetical protein